MRTRTRAYHVLTTVSGPVGVDLSGCYEADYSTAIPHRISTSPYASQRWDRPAACLLLQAYASCCIKPVVSTCIHSKYDKPASNMMIEVGEMRCVTDHTILRHKPGSEPARSFDRYRGVSPGPQRAR